MTANRRSSCLLLGTMIAATAFAFASEVQAAPPPPPPGQVWIPNNALTDEFNAGALNSTKWRPAHAWWVGRPPSKFVPSNISVSDGALKLVTTALPPEDSSSTVWLGAPCVSSLEPIAGFGYYEARVKASPSSLASAFFLQRKDGEEIDVAENFGASPLHPEMAFQNRTNTHFFPNGYQRGNDTHSIAPLRTPNTEWHVYGVWYRNPNEAWIYTDGALTSKEHLKGPMDRPMYMFFDAEPTGQGIPTASQLRDSASMTMSVDWVRSYTLAPQ